MLAAIRSRFSGLSARDTAPALPEPSGAGLRSDRFRLEREADWLRLEAIVRQMEKGRLRRIADEDLLALPALYRTAASSLAAMRETSLDAATLAYLEHLVQRAWFQVYGPRRGFAGWLREFLLGGWSRAVRGLSLDILVALLVMVAGVIVGWLLVAGDVEWYYRLVPGGLGEVRVPGASREQLAATLAVEEQVAGLSTFAAYLFSNNAGVCILAFALGFAFGIPSLMLLIQNLAVMGAMLWVFHQAGLTVDFIAWLSVHGTTELFAILLAGAAGLHIGRSMAFPGDRSIMAAAAQSGQRAAVVMLGVVLMLIVAALLEGYVRQLLTDTQGRFAVGGAMLAFWIGYLFLWRGRQAGGAP